MPAPKPCSGGCIRCGRGKRFDCVILPEPALNQVQEGDEPIAAKALKGFGGRTVVELVDDLDGDTYRALYTVRFAGAVYVLHAFQKKAKKASPRPSTRSC